MDEKGEEWMEKKDLTVRTRVRENDEGKMAVLLRVLELNISLPLSSWTLSI
jgi:hypothetical protein